MRYTMILGFAAAIMMSAEIPVAHAGLRELMAVGKSQEQIQKALKKETKHFEEVKEAILEGKIKEGTEASRVHDKYGEPVIEIFDDRKNVTKWLYMPAGSTHFKGEKLYLYVNDEGAVVGWRLVEQ